MTNIFFASDHHFYHKRIREFSPKTRRGESVEEMNELLIQAHNSIVKQNDLVYFLGDFSFGNAEQTKRIAMRLNGQKHLILGNHDDIIRRTKEIQELFVTVQDYKDTSIEKIKISMFHFPIAEFNQQHRGAYHFHGHTHGSYSHAGRGFDVGIDNRPDDLMQPWVWEDLKRIVKKKPILSHH